MTTTRDFIVEVKDLNGNQQELLIRTGVKAVPVRVDSNGVEHADIMIINPAAHDLINIINHSTAGHASIAGVQDPFVTGEGELVVQHATNEKVIPVGPIKLVPTPMIDAAVIMINHFDSLNGRIALGNIECLGEINFIDGSK